MAGVCDAPAPLFTEVPGGAPRSREEGSSPHEGAAATARHGRAPNPGVTRALKMSPKWVADLTKEGGCRGAPGPGAGPWEEICPHGHARVSVKDRERTEAMERETASAARRSEKKELAPLHSKNKPPH